MSGSLSNGTVDLESVEAELAPKGLRFRFVSDAFERRFQDERRRSSSMQNQLAICLTVLLYDVFYWATIKVSPEILGLSIVVRVAIMTPLTILFVALDRRRRLGRWADIWVPALLVMPTALAAVEILHVTSLGALTNVQATSLLQLAILCCRTTTLQAVIITALSCLIYTCAVLASAFIPPAAIPSLLLTDYSIAAAAIVFAVRFERRDRQVFLLNLHASAGRAVLAAQNEALARIAQLDALTGLGNRRCFDEKLAMLWTDGAATLGPITLVLFDIDCFKLFNDRNGHQAGDECLTMIGRTLSRCRTNDADTLVRYGGEEFALILPNTQLAEGLVVAERLRQSVYDRAIPHPDAGPLPFVTVSLGVAAVTPSLQSSAMLVEAADRCLYAAKRAGRNRVVGQETPSGLELPLGDKASRDPQKSQPGVGAHHD